MDSNVDGVRVGSREGLFDGKLFLATAAAAKCLWQQPQKKISPPLHLTYHITEMHIMSFFQVLLELWTTMIVRHGEMFT